MPAARSSVAARSCRVVPDVQPDAALIAGQNCRAGAAVWLGSAAASAAALVAGSVLAMHHPLWPAAAVGGFAVWALAVARWPALWLSVVPAALPLANLSPWSGWIGLDEFDLLLLATLCGSYGRWALDRWSGRGAILDPVGPPARIAVALGLLLVASSLLGLYRALAGIPASTSAGFRAMPTR